MVHLTGGGKSSPGFFLIRAHLGENLGNLGKPRIPLQPGLAFPELGFGDLA